jgi:uracil-DNA glycosylase
VFGVDAAERATSLDAVAAEAAECVRCPLAEGRTHVVFGEGNPDADLVLVGEAPGFHEDRDGVPFAGRAGELLERLLAAVGLSLDDTYRATVLKCRPPGNRDPLPAETSACEPYLYRQLELIQPTVVATLGSFATALLSVTLLPLYHPAAALYTPTMLAVLERDVARLPELLGETPLPAPLAVEPVRVEALAGARPVQLGLF